MRQGLPTTEDHTSAKDEPPLLDHTGEVLCLAFLPLVTTRTLTISGGFQTQGTLVISRAITATGEVEWTEKTTWADKDTSSLSRRYGKEGNLLSWISEDVHGRGKRVRETDAWSVKPEGDAFRITFDLLKNSKVGQSKLDKTAALDTSLFWWNGTLPKLGDSVRSATLITELLGVGRLEPLLITYRSDEMTRGNPTHRITREGKTVSVTWWLDDEGMPVRRTFWTRNEKDPHRVDMVKGL